MVIYLSTPSQVHLFMSACSCLLAAGLTGLLFYSVFEDLNDWGGDND